MWTSDWLQYRTTGNGRIKYPLKRDKLEKKTRYKVHSVSFCSRGCIT